MADLSSIPAILALLRKAIRANRRRIQRVALETLEGLYKQRIFNRGLSSDGRQIGKYSTKDMLIGRSSFSDGKGGGGIGTKEAGKKAFAKRQKPPLKWVTLGKGPGRKRLAVLKGGYAKFRKLSGRQTSKVDLEFTSDLRNGIQIGTNKSDLVFGFINDKERIKAEGNQARFKKDIFDISATEQKAVDKAIIREIDAILIKALR